MAFLRKIKSERGGISKGTFLLKVGQRMSVVFQKGKCYKNNSNSIRLETSFSFSNIPYTVLIAEVILFCCKSDSAESSNNSTKYL